MIEQHNIKIDVDGGESTGKATAVTEVVDILLSAEKIWIGDELYDSDEVFIVQVGFPNYAGPVGGLIRAMNKGAADSFFEKLGDKEAEIRVKKSIFALDRIMTEIQLAILLKDTDKQIIRVSDRGPLSQVMTHAYALQESDEVFWDSLSTLEKLTDADKLLWEDVQRQVTVLINNVSMVGSGVESVEGGRTALDLMETATEANELVRQFYERTVKEDKSGKITTVNARDKNERFRRKERIGLDILHQNNIVPVLTNSESISMDNRFEAHKSGKLIHIGGKEFIDLFWDEDEAVSDFGGRDRLTRIFSWADRNRLRKQFIGASRASVKGVLDTIDDQNLRYILEKLAGKRISKSVVKEIPMNLINEGRRLLGSYSDFNLIELIAILEYEKEYPARAVVDFLCQVFFFGSTYEELLTVAKAKDENTALWRLARWVRKISI